MFINLLGSLFDIFTRRQRRARCPIRVHASARATLIVCVAVFARSAYASIAQSGDVTPADNPFTLNVNEGIPNGNTWNIFEAVNHQTFFEGRHVDGSNPPTNDDNINFNITVGQKSSGTLLISGESALRDMNLIIGDHGTLNGVQNVPGTGVVRITGFGSLYNNNPYILPAEVQNVSGFQSARPRTAESGAMTGFDTWVGRWGTGTLEVTAGARAELEDSLLVGDNIGSVGNLTVDGIDSFVGNGGFSTSGGGGISATDPHMMVIGRLGSGNMTVSTGGTVVSEAPLGTTGGTGGTTGPMGAVLGSTPYTLTLGQVPDAGGNGTATITGNGSKWTIGGSLQIGGFDIGTSTNGAVTTIGDAEGDNTSYPSQAGRGTLNVNDGALVQIRNAIDVSPTDTQTPLQLAIGHFGTVRLNGGTIRIGNANTSGGSGTGNQAIPDVVSVINDGVITGTGRIETGGFRNRYFGEVRVNPGQSLVIDAGAQFANAGGLTTPPEPLVNYGKITVTGSADSPGYLEFVRAPAAGSSNPLRPFINAPLPFTALPTAGTFVGGQISAQYANLNFGSGLQNQSMLAFTAGTNNVIGTVVTVPTDTVDTESAGETAGDSGEIAQVLVSGPTTTAVFHDDLSFASNGDLNLVNGGNVVVLNQHSLTLSGNLGIELSYAHPSKIVVGGDVGIGNGTSDLTVNLAADVLHSLKHGDAFEIISFGGDIGNVNLTNPTNPVPDLTMMPLFTDRETSPNVKALYGLDMVVQISNEGVYVVFLNPMAVGGGAGAMGPDFNGDGKVDSADLAIWQAHVGITSGASVLEGDANGDGRVDGQDFLMWQRNVGKPKPWLGSGAAVPEPASLAMLLCATAAALVVSRRR